MIQHKRTHILPLGAAASAALALGAAVLPTGAAVAEEPVFPTAAVLDGTLFVNGTQNPDAITIGVSPDPSTFTVNFGGAAPAEHFLRTSFHAVIVALSDGNDVFGVSPLVPFSDVALTVDGGQGDDAIGGSAGADLLVGGEGADTIRGGDGNDLIHGGSGADDIDGERGIDTQDLGAGADAALWLPGEGSDIIDGGGGHDSLTFVGSAGNEAFGLQPDLTGTVFTRDLGGIRMDLVRLEQLDVHALAGADTVDIGDLSGADVRNANIDLGQAGAPDGVLDAVSVAGTDQPDHVSIAADDLAVSVSGLHTQVRILGNDSRDQLDVDTAGGDDTVAVTDAAAASIGVTVDLGTDQH